MNVSDEGLALGGRNGIGSLMGAPSLTRSVRRSPSLPMTYSGSTPPNGIGAMVRRGGAAGAKGSPVTGRGGAAAAGRRRGSLNTAAPRPGSPTALDDRAPRAPPPAATGGGASVVRRLGVAMRPPGHSHVLGG